MEQKKVITKPSLEEDKIHGTREFPVQVYRENYAPYPMGIMDIHWHRFLELDIVVKGKIKIQDGDKEYILETGQGIFVNSNVLHKSRALGVPGETEQMSLIFAPEFLAPSDSAIYKEEIQPFLGQEGISTDAGDSLAEGGPAAFYGGGRPVPAPERKPYGNPSAAVPDLEDPGQ